MLSDEELEFLDTQLQFVKASIEESRDAIIDDRSLGMYELLRFDNEHREDVELCNGLLGKVRREIRARGGENAGAVRT